MFKLTAALNVFMLLSFSAFAEPEIKGTPAELSQYLRNVPKTTTITGDAEVRVPAHRAVVNLKVATENRSMQEALRLNQEFRTKLSEQLKKRGIAEDRISSARFSSTPRPGVFSDKARSFKIENSIRVTVTDESEFNTIAAAVDAWSEVQFVGVEFEYTDKESSKQKALAQACDKVSERKRFYEEKFGVSLVPVSFQEGNVISSDQTTRDAYARKAAGYSIMAGVESVPAFSPAPVAVGEAASSFGEMICTAHIAVEYSVQPK